MTPTLRKLTVTTHLVSSVGWLGAVLVFLGLAVVGLTSRNEATVRGAYLVMVPAAWFVLVPLAHTSVLSGVALSLGTAWGLFRHYWVAVKLVITVFATVLLMVYVRTFSHLANIAGDSEAALSLVRSPSPAVHSALALVVLSVATWLGVYKPFGLTPYGVRSGTRDTNTPKVGQAAGGLEWSWSVLAVMILIAVVLVVGLLHAATGGLRH